MKKSAISSIAFGFACLVLASPLRADPSETKPLKWAGVFPTVITPFRSVYGGVDVASLQGQIGRALAAGVHGLVVLDSYGEGDLVNAEERDQVIATAVRLAFPRVPVIVGIQTCDVNEARAQLMRAKQLGASAVLVEYLGDPGATLEQVYSFYAELANLKALPIFYDHFPSRTGIMLRADMLSAIVAIPGVAGVREAIVDQGELELHQRMCRGLGKAFFSGTALNLTQFLDLGWQGVMCPEATLLPGVVVQAFDAHVHGQHEDARTLQEQLFDLTPVLSLKPTVPLLTRVAYMAAQDLKIAMPMCGPDAQAQMKSALTCLGVPTPAWVKGPLPELTVWEQRCVRSAVGRIRCLDVECCGYRRVPPIPYRTCAEAEGGALLKTGAFQLGRGVGKDLLRSQGDGMSGFPQE